MKTEAANLITLNRLNNLISKIGKPMGKSKKQRAHVLQLYIEDVIEDLEANLNIVFTDLDQSDRETTLALIKQEAKKIIGDR